MLSVSVCEKDTLCVNCDDEKCIHNGQAYADCPKYHCDNPDTQNCSNCNFIKEYQRLFRIAKEK